MKQMKCNMQFCSTIFHQYRVTGTVAVTMARKLSERAEVRGLNH